MIFVRGVMNFISNMCLSYRSNSLRIPYYHLVSNTQKPHYFPNKAISIETFRAHIKFLKSQYEFITMNDALASFEKGDSLSRKIVLTFDDGFAQNYHNVLPILQEEKICGLFFLIGNCIDNNDLMWRNKLLVINKTEKCKLYEAVSRLSQKFNVNQKWDGSDLLKWSMQSWPMNLKEDYSNYLWETTQKIKIEEYLFENNPYLTRSQIKEMVGLGHEIGSHSMSHPNFQKLDYPEAESEINNSLSVLNSIINNKVKYFSYPFGLVPDDHISGAGKQNPAKSLVAFGTKNSLNNSGDVRIWQRDNIEYKSQRMLFQFLVLPICRNIFSS